MQLEIFARAIQRDPDNEYQLFLIGGARNQDDLDRVESLRQEAKNLGIEVHRRHLTDPCVCIVAF
jgi:hypothetical protein